MSWLAKCARMIEEGNLPIGEPCYPVLLKTAQTQRSDTNLMLFHFCLWLKSNPEVKSYRFMIDIGKLTAPVMNTACQSYWVLLRKNDQDAFLQWLENYETWFAKPVNDSLLPEIPDSGIFTLSIVPFAFDQSDDNYSGQWSWVTDELFERWSWITKNCKNKVYVIPYKGFAFTDSTDGVFYKLTWCDHDAG